MAKQSAGQGLPEVEPAPVPLELTIGEAAAIVGVLPHTLRAWERRYQIVLPRRSASNQRRYTIEDVRLLSAVKEAIGGRSHSVRRVVEKVSATRSEGPPAGAGPARGVSVWRTAMDLMPLVMLLLDGQGRVVDANAAAADATGIVQAQLRGRQFTELIAPADRSRAAAIYRRPWRQRRGWRLVVGSDTAAIACRFDCWPVQSRARGEVLVLVGQELPPPDAV